jgi:alpha-glucosidase
MRVMGDLTTNHSGWKHEWFLAAQGDPDAAERDLYFMEPDGSYVGWYALETLPKFRPGTEFYTRLIDGPDSVARRWLAPPFELDGWRIDVANMTGRQGDVDANTEVSRRLRAAMVEERPDAYLVAEHCHDASADLRTGGWHGAMNYAGFLRPLWSWLRLPEYRSSFLGLPADVPRSSGRSAVATVTAFVAATPWREMTASWSLIGSHDTPRVRTVLGECASVAAGILFTFPGVPMMFMGDEWGGEGVDGEDARRPMPWDRPESRDSHTFARYRSLIALRRGSSAHRDGGLRWVHAGDDAISYVREHLDESMWCVAVREGTQRLQVPVTMLGITQADDAEAVYGEADLTVADGEVHVTVTGPAFVAWRLPGVARPGTA